MDEKLNKNGLTEEEQEIEDSLDFDKLEPVKDPELEEKLKQAAGNYLKKDARINIRLSNHDLRRIKSLAAREGLPYQTMISSILHKVANGLYDPTSNK